MTKLCSLIFRELKASKKMYILRFAVLLAFCFFIMGAIFLLTHILEQMPEDTLRSFTQMFSMFVVIYSAAVFSGDSVFVSDLKSGWHNYSYALPITAADRGAAKLICFLGTVSISSLFGLGCVFINCLIAGTQFRIGYVVLLFIVLDIILLFRIIMDFFVLRARNTDEYKKMYETGGLAFLVCGVCIAFVILKCIGFDFGALFTSDSTEPLFFDISTLTGKMLLWLIPLTVVLCAGQFAVIRHHLEYAYPDGVKIKKSNVKAETAADISAPHCEPVGFLYKEIRQNSKSIITVILLPFLILVFLTCCLAIVSLSEEYGGDGWIVRTLTSDVFRIMSIALGFFSVSGLLLSVFHGDDKKLWAYFIASSPMGVEKFLYTKYVLSFAMCGLYFVSSYFAETLLATISWFALGKELTGFASIFIIIFFALILQNSFSIPMMLRFGEKKGSIINLIIILCLAIMAILVLSFIPREIQDKVFAWLASFITGEHGGLTMLLLGLFPGFSVGAYILSYKVSCKIFMKGVNEYDK
ncbi:MAG: ABC-2 transporter permease [Oscillospiraceae bacterium]